LKINLLQKVKNLLFSPKIYVRLFIKTVIIILFFFVSTVHAQLKLNALETDVRLNRIDIFQDYNVRFTGLKTSHTLGVGYGINKTIFQKQFYPVINYSLSFNLINTLKWHFNVQLSYYLSIYKPSKLVHQWLFFNECMPGVTISYGEKHELFFKPEFGLLIHSMRDNKQFEHFFSNSYQLKIGYALHL
jgi:hypothetical protein